ncbi:MAG: lysine N(6)-hydroxylase/L-ornithine N(5)-oxygenase family protein [Actinomycetota bacterium]
MSQTGLDGHVPVADVVGIGFGPSNLALAIAVEEHNERTPIDTLVSATFLERQPAFGWHRGMLIEDATMQVCFIKDLVTLRNPSSPFGFLSYLHWNDRLLDFINHKSLYPLRIEFHDYLEWAAARVADYVTYGVEVEEIHPVWVDGAVEAVDVVAVGTSGRTERRRARNLVVAAGLEPTLPPTVERGERVWHSHELLPRVAAMGAATPRRLVVVGAGQSAAEATAFLHRRFPGAEVCAVFSRYGYSPADDSNFANRIFDPSAVDEFFSAPPAVRRKLLDYHRNTNYSVVDQELIEDLYGRVYQETVLGVERLRLLNVSRVVDLVDRGDAVRIAVESMMTGERTVLDADVVVYATGYRPVDTVPLLGELAEHCELDEQGDLRVLRDYRVATSPTVRCGVYLQGGTEHTHGISSSLLSNTAVRAGEILDSVVQRRRCDVGPVGEPAAGPGPLSGRPGRAEVASRC